ncbi:MAG: putrescine---pyruvate transaminase [Solirubrobacteraceae bacterium]|jgi:adenosylmethionine-8-amino-7-oxononanoate aminotransferase|nr:putrescine---pyruvate transaminase [Solirubrobacteraceae bacterium]
MPADSRFWHPFADMHAVRSNELVIARGDGVHVWDEDGNRYLDGTASLWCVNVGHGRQEIVEAAAAQMRELASYSTFGNFANRPALDLTERLAALAPLDDPRIFLGSGGGDAIDTAAKLARRYFAAIGEPDRVHLISRTQGYHGTHGLGTSIGGIPANRMDVGPLDPNASQVPHDSLDALRDEIDRIGADRVAAVFVEPVIGAGGVHQPAPGYVEGVAELCQRTGVLFVCDAVIGAFGRLGTWFAAERFGVRPDLLCFAKGVTSGYLPLGGVVVSAKVAAPFWEDGAWFRHGPTYAGHPTVCAAAMANLDIMEREGLLERGRELEDEIADALRGLADAPLVGDVRAGMGALGAVVFAPEALSEAPDLPQRTLAAARERGLLVRPLGDAVAISPPLVITREQVEHAAEVIGDALEAVARDVPAAAGAR